MQIYGLKNCALVITLIIITSFQNIVFAQKQISEQEISLNVLRSDARDNLKKCNPQNYTGILKDLCLYFADNELSNESIKNECLSKYRIILESKNIQYETSDNCEQLKGKLSD